VNKYTLSYPTVTVLFIVISFGLVPEALEEKQAEVSKLVISGQAKVKS
jgi:hypothetical protein